MSQINVLPTGIDGLYVIEPLLHGDERGYFTETYNQRDFRALGLDMTFVQDNESRSRRGVLRGLHFQKANPQGKLVRVTQGEVFDVAVDLRKNSPSFGKWVGAILSAENKKQFYVPEGFAHGFLVLSEYATFVYKCTRLYDPASEGGILYNDKDLAIDWPTDTVEDLLLSEKDKKNSTFADLGFAF